MPSTFHTRTPLAASAETMFAFHSDPHNLSHVMPPTLKVTRLETDLPAREGGLIRIHCRDWGLIPMSWVCRWKTVEPPHLLVDEMIQGPFAVFIHQHRFEPDGSDRCIMHDHITYQWGRSWWGRIVSEIGVRLYLTILFRYRQYRTRKWVENNSSSR